MLTRWLFSTNAKDIGTLYLMYGIFTALIGTAFSILIRLELSAPGSQFLAGDNQMFNVIITAHGLIMVLFMVVPTMSGFANYMVPVLIGAPDMAFPRLNNISFWILIPALVLIVASVFVEQGAGSFPIFMGDGLFLQCTATLFCIKPAYMAGLIEGDGSLIVPKALRDNSGKKRYPVIKIVFALKDQPLALYIASVFGGSVHKAGGQWVEYRLQSQAGVHALADYINGYMRTPKIDALHIMINWFNANTKLPTITPLGLDSSPVLSNSWLSGMLDADGSFQIVMGSSLKTGFAIGVDLYMILTQRLMYHVPTASFGASYKPVILSIVEALGGNLVESTRERAHGTENVVGVKAKSVVARTALISYLDEYPLMSSKRLDSLDWVKAHSLVLGKGYNSLEGTHTLQALKSRMNTQRSVFDWSHLSS